MLARPPAAVTVRDIVDSLEGGISVVECVQNPSVCSRVGLCATRTVWASLEEKISETLSSVTLEDLISKCRLNEREYIYSI